MQIDYSLFKLVNGLSGNAIADRSFTFLAQNLATLLMVLVALAFLVPWKQRRDERRRGAVIGTAAAGLALLVAQPIAHLVARARPYADHPVHLLIARSPDPSFPSDHATGAFALAFGLWLYDRTLGTVLLVLAALLSVSRVYVGTHYPGDVLAGALLGAGMAGALYLLPTRKLVELVVRFAGALTDRVLVRPHSAA
ncbi:phosphatase PAP2 family protein [Solirubrobacter ginsenosidimutans]|uniref:Phosphatase PAP2 family protein n=1 Tax=Solirubrobacter ginsenosidimutans TaxID=490573 RepID=A0A9X3MUS5_9ACTN|nr:phosphatase PAP2 family protein [Solirubrobacter ginsenosidimutans]MDA0161662.1 phosphatase PAP2 family protein [Solirubrobacter ginsenosidimutans]